MPDVTMPRLSDTMQEGTIARWLKQVGDPVKRGEVLAQIETDKATMDLEAYDSGVLQEVLAPEGETVPIGQAIARIGSEDGKETGQRAAPAESAAGSAEPTEGADTGTRAGDKPLHYGGGEGTVPPEPAEKQPSPVRPEPVEGREEEAVSPERNGKLRASPLARRMAAEHGVELGSLRGSGPEGRVIRADVEAAVAGGPAAGARSSAGEARPVHRPDGPDEERVPLSQMRKIIARRMAESTRTIPHFALTTAVDATELVTLRKQLVDQMAAAGEDDGKVSLNDFILRACALAIRKVPEINVSFAETELVIHHRVHVGMAVSLDNGLIVPVVRDVDTKDVAQISREARDLAIRARQGKLKPDEYSGGTFTVSNLGMFGVESFNAVINPPEAAILAVGAVSREPAEHKGELVLRDRLRLTLSVDHRAVDGATGARYLQALKQLLEQPLSLLLSFQPSADS